MANPIRRLIAKIDDLTLHQSFERVCELVFPDGDAEEHITDWYYSVGGVSELLSEDIEDEAEFTGRYTFETAQLAFKVDGAQITVSFSRQILFQQNSNRAPSADFDQFDITFGQNVSHFDNIDVVTAVMRGLFDDKSAPVAPRSPDANVIAQQIQGFGAAHRQMLKQLNAQFALLTERQRQMEEEHRRKQDERNAEHEMAMQALEDERKKLELESYKARRRTLQTALTQKSAVERRSEYVSPSARYISLLVPFMGILASGAGFFMAYQSVGQLTLNSSAVSEIVATVTADGGNANVAEGMLETSLTLPTIYLMVKSILSSALAVGGLLYAAGWLRRMYNSEVETSHEIDRFNYDILRANWVIESVLEVTKEHEGQVPQEWIEGVTRRLFDGGARAEPEDKDQLAMQALLGMSSSAKVGPDGITIDLNKRNLRNIVRAAEEAE